MRIWFISFLTHASHTLPSLNFNLVIPWTRSLETSLFSREELTLSSILCYKLAFSLWARRHAPSSPWVVSSSVTYMYFLRLAIRITLFVDKKVTMHFSGKNWLHFPYHIPGKHWQYFILTHLHGTHFQWNLQLIFQIFHLREYTPFSMSKRYTSTLKFLQ